METDPKLPETGSKQDLALDFDAHEPDWDPSTLDLDAYLTRIAYDGPREPTAAVLAAIQRAHVATVPFENIDVLLRRGAKTDLAGIEEKLVRARRGGYCFEQNPLLTAALTRLGFRVRRGGARGPMGPEQNSPLRYGSGHAMLVAEAEGQAFLCDVGVGYLGSSTPVPLVDGGVFEDGAWRYRTDRVTAGPHFKGWMLRLLLPAGWSNVYAFSDQPFFAADYADQNFTATDHPESPFREQVIVQRTGPDERWSLRDLKLTRRRPDGEPQVETLASENMRETLRARFGLTLDDGTADAVVAFAARKAQPGQDKEIDP